MRLGELTDSDNPSLHHDDLREVIRQSSVEVMADTYSLLIQSQDIKAAVSSAETQSSSQGIRKSTTHLFIFSVICDLAIKSLLCFRHSGSAKPDQRRHVPNLHLAFRLFSLQPFDAGGANPLAELGTPPKSLIRAIGRWKSDAFEGYIKKDPVPIQALLFSHRV